MSEEKAIVIHVEPEVKLGSLTVNHPEDMIARASAIATQLAKVVKDRKLSRNISGREYVYVDGWSTLGALIGVLPREVENQTRELENGDFMATVELIRVTDGAVVGRGSAIVGSDERTWNSRPRYARRSMAVTRATGKAYRLGFSWIMSLAGYATTPAEEMDGIDGEYREERAAQHAPTNGKATQETTAEVEAMPLAEAEAMTDSKGNLYGKASVATLTGMANSIMKKIQDNGLTSEERAACDLKIKAIRTILAARNANGGAK